MFVVHCKDKPGAMQIRLDNRAAHLAFLQSYPANVVMAGPVLTDDRQAMIGSVLIVDFADRAALDAFLDNDPYGKAGLFDSITVLPWKKALP